MKVISFSIFKGGAGKTTSSVNTAVSLAKKGKRVLLVDLDQRASATRYLDLDPDQAPSLYEVYMGAKPAALAIKYTKFGVDMLTSNGLLAAIEEALEPGDELKLAEYLTPLKPSYDFILIDTPPGKADTPARSRRSPSPRRALPFRSGSWAQEQAGAWAQEQDRRRRRLTAAPTSSADDGRQGQWMPGEKTSSVGCFCEQCSG
jgi:hypothetical protein